MSHFQVSGSLPTEISRFVDAELRPGERIVWSGQPMPGRFALRSMGLVIFGIPWTAFSLFWIAGASGFKIPDLNNRMSLLMPLFGLPFVLIGMGLLSSPYWMMKKAKRSTYVITDQRAMILEGGLWGSTAIRSFAPDRLKDIRRIQRSDGTGDLIFERTWTSDGDGGKNSTDHGFLAIADVRGIEQMIARLAEAN